MPAASGELRVVTERGTTYLMGRVTPREADRGTDQIICECELMPRRKLEGLLERRPSAT